MRVPYEIADPNHRKMMEEVYRILEELKGEVKSKEVIARGTVTGHRWKIEVDDTNNIAPNVHFTDLGD